MGEYMSVPIKNKESEDGFNDSIKFGACGMQGWRRSMEDTHIAKLDIGDGISLFGVFDGHGGKEVACFTKNHLAEEIMKMESFKKGDYKSCLEETFLKMDELLTTPNGRKELATYSKNANNKSGSLFSGEEEDNVAFFAGCTACVALITKEEIYIANAGDSRCVASKKSGVLPLSIDHSPDVDTEIKRIEKAGGVIDYGRVNGSLNLTRSLGDLEHKLNSALKQEEQVITAFPEVRVEKRSADLKFLIIACDGIWDCLTNEKAVDFVNERIEKIKNDKDDKLSLIVESMFDTIIATDVAGSGGIGCDNMTCLIIEFK